MRGEEVWFSEVSPRPHDTGLVTLASQTMSEFALHARAILGLPVDVTQREPAASAVIYGGLDAQGIAFEGVAEALSVPTADLRLFGKPEAFERRRMGVAVARGADVEEARDRAALAAHKVSVTSTPGLLAQGGALFVDGMAPAAGVLEGGFEPGEFERVLALQLFGLLQLAAQGVVRRLCFVADGGAAGARARPRPRVSPARRGEAVVCLSRAGPRRCDRPRPCRRRASRRPCRRRRPARGRSGRAWLGRRRAAW